MVLGLLETARVNFWTQRAAQKIIPWRNAILDYYTEGRYLQRDYEQAAAMYQKSAEQGDPVAQKNSCPCIILDRECNRMIKKHLIGYKISTATLRVGTVEFGLCLSFRPGHAKEYDQIDAMVSFG